ncbi:MAG: 50S ribosomal protein L9 [Bacteroidetes bacterium]|jgi:large subunit ribosomal protein L9|nr:50S ribosomal protein L9 [Bacteroidota bacterium]
MQVILLKNVEHLGQEGEIHEVADGYGRNYLIPQGMARMATEGAIKQVREEERQARRRKVQERKDAEKVAEELGDMELVFTAKVGEENRIFGTVTTQQIAVELDNRGFDVDRKNIELDEDIRYVGLYTARVQLHPDVEQRVKIRVMPESGPDAA